MCEALRDGACCSVMKEGQRGPRRGIAGSESAKVSGHLLSARHREQQVDNTAPVP